MRVQIRNRSRGKGVVVAGLLVALLVAAVPSVAALHETAGDGMSYSGDDAYDPAAGGLPVLFEASTNSLVPAWLSHAGSGLSGDDAYDPAAGGLPVLLVASADSVARAWLSEASTTFSGDDPYDPAAGSYP